MKEVMAIIRMDKINQTKRALVENGFPAFTAHKAKGRGKRPVDMQVLEHINENPSTGAEMLSSLAEGPRLFPKRLITMIVPDDKVSDVVEIVVKINRTGTPGDGKIFVMPVSDVLRIRTRESGQAAVDEMQGAPARAGEAIA